MFPSLSLQFTSTFRLIKSLTNHISPLYTEICSGPPSVPPPISKLAPASSSNFAIWKFEFLIASQRGEYSSLSSTLILTPPAKYPSTTPTSPSATAMCMGPFYLLAKISSSKSAVLKNRKNAKTLQCEVPRQNSLFQRFLSPVINSSPF